MSKTVDMTVIKGKLLDQLNKSGWGVKLRGYLLSEDFDVTLDALLEVTTSGKHFTPPLKYVFRAFDECPYRDLMVVFVGMDPYTYLGTADGISFSCSLTNKEQPSLRFINDAIAKTVYPGEEYKRPTDLKVWSNQGILMLNAALTTEVNKSGAHLSIWKSFTTYLLDMLNSENSGLVFVFLGNDAKQFADLINEDNHYKIFAKHPASASYNGSVWDCNDLFNQINNIVQKNYKTSIKW